MNKVNVLKFLREYYPGLFLPEPPMNQQQFQAEANQFFASVEKLVTEKNQDYAGKDGDALQGFKDLAHLTGESVFTCWKVMFCKQFLAVRRHMEGQELITEGIDSRFMDIDAFGFLGLMLCKEKDKPKPQTVEEIARRHAEVFKPAIVHPPQAPFVPASPIFGKPTDNVNTKGIVDLPNVHMEDKVRDARPSLTDKDLYEAVKAYVNDPANPVNVDVQKANGLLRAAFPQFTGE